MTALRFALVGDPVAHSRSPAMHDAAYRALGMPHSYEAWRARGEAELAAAVARLRSGEVAGLNVTIPHKRAVLAFADELDPVARAVGACNTLAVRGGKVVAYDTDVAAVADELLALVPGARGGAALVLGSGGAARAAVVACALHLGVDRVVVRARRDAAATCAELERRLAELGCKVHIFAAPLPPPSPTPSLTPPPSPSPSPSPPPPPPLTPPPRWVVQATSAGMTGADPGDAVAVAVPWADLAPGAVALDVVYSPPETPFLRAARAAGVHAANGLGMLARQGAAAFELWLGVPAPLEVMRRALA